MRASIRAHLPLVSSAAAQASSSPSISTITAAPESGVPAALIGSQYVTQFGTSTTYYCPVGQIWSTQGRYAACCANDPYQECPFAVSCESTSLLVGPEGEYTFTCSGTSSDTVCITGLVYESTSGTAAVTNVQCWSNWDGGFWVATKAASTSAATASSTIVTTTTTDKQPSASNPTPIGAIIGGVIGGLALLTFLGVCLWFTCSSRGQQTRRKWSSESSTQEEEKPVALAPEVIEEAGGTSVVVMVDDEPNVGRLPKEMHAEACEAMMVDDEPNVGRLPKEMHTEAHEVTAGNTATAQTMEQGTGDDAASASSFRTADV